MTRSILVADDSPDNLELLVFMIKSMGEEYKVIKANDGREALKLAVQNEPDLALLDWDMPEMNGIETMVAIHQMKELANIPVIIATAYTSSENLKEALEKGAVDFLKKPIDSIELRSRIGAALRLAESYKRIRNQKEKIEEQKNELEAANQLKDKLFSVISHDMKGPLQSLSSLLEIFIHHAEGLTMDELKQYASKIKGNLNGISFLLNNLLKWSLSQMNKMAFDEEHFDVTELVATNLELYQVQASEKEIELIKEEISTRKVLADADSIDFVFRNLLANAIKFTRKGGKVRVFATTAGNRLKLGVQDTGVGISAENLAILKSTKEVFSTRGTAEEKGTGLGLNLCKEFIAKNKGTLEIESEEGKGSTFSILLPLA